MSSLLLGSFDLQHTKRRGEGEIFPALLSLADAKIDSAGDGHGSSKYVRNKWLMFS